MRVQISPRPFAKFMSNGYPEQVRAYLSHPWLAFKDAWHFYHQHFKLISQIVSWPILISLLGLWSDSQSRPLIYLLDLTVAIWASAALICLLGSEEGPETLTYRLIYRRALVFFLPLVWLTLLIIIIVSGGLAVLLVPGLIWFIYLIFGAFILIDQKSRGLAALVASWAYVEKYWWSVLGRLIFFILLVMPLTLALFLLGFLVSPITASVVGLVLLWLLILPLFLIYFFRFYTQLKLFKPQVEVIIDDAVKRRRWLGVFAFIGLVVLAALDLYL